MTIRAGHAFITIFQHGTAQLGRRHFSYHDKIYSSASIIFEPIVVLKYVINPTTFFTSSILSPNSILPFQLVHILQTCFCLAIFWIPYTPRHVSCFCLDIMDVLTGAHLVR